MKYNETMNTAIDSITYSFWMNIKDLVKMSDNALGYVTNIYSTSIFNDSISFTFITVDSDKYGYSSTMEGVIAMYRFIKANNIKAEIVVNRRFKNGCALYTNNHGRK